MGDDTTRMYRRVIVIPLFAATRQKRRKKELLKVVRANGARLKFSDKSRLRGFKVYRKGHTCQL